MVTKGARTGIIREMRKLVVVALVAALAFGAPATATLHSGLYGIVRKGPIMPVCRTDVPCDAPAQVTLLFTRAGSIVARTKSDAEGRYRVATPAGYYSVRTQPRIGFGAMRPMSVHVRNGHFDRLNFFLDTGIR